MIKRAQASQDFDRALAKKVFENRRMMGYTIDFVLDELSKKGLVLCKRSYNKIESGERPLYPLELLLICNILNIDLSALSTPGRNGQTFSQSCGGKF